MDILDQYGNKLSPKFRKIGFALNPKPIIKRTFNDWVSYGNVPKNTKVSIIDNTIINFKTK